MNILDICRDYPLLLEDILTGIQQAIILTDAQGSVLYASKMTERIVGFRPEELYGLELSQIFTEEDLAYLYPNIMFLARNFQTFDGELMLRRKNNTTFFAYLISRPCCDGHPDRMIIAVSIQDIDKQKKFEKALRETHFDDLIKIANGIAHELRNPLTSIGGFVNRLYKSCQTSITQEHYYDYIIDNLRRIENLVKKVDYLVSLPKPNFKMESVRLLLDQTLGLYSSQLETRKIVLDCRVEDSQVLVDRDLLSRAVAILVENALDAMASPGSLSINTVVNESHFEIRIRDTGTGINAQDLPFIFNPFFSTKPTGAGIDLAVVKRIMESHGGRVEVESSAGHGATFILNFPLERRRAIRIATLETRSVADSGA